MVYMVLGNCASVLAVLRTKKNISPSRGTTVLVMVSNRDKRTNRLRSYWCCYHEKVRPSGVEGANSVALDSQGAITDNEDQL